MFLKGRILGKDKLLTLVMPMVAVSFAVSSLCIGNAAGINTRRGKCTREVAVVTDLQGIIETPGYPRRYKNNQICIWRIHVRRGFQVKLTFDLKDGFGIEENENCLQGDSLIISSKRQTFQRYRPSVYSRGSHSLVFCGREGTKSTILSPTNTLWLRFRADKRKGSNQIGFRARYTAIDINECLKSNKRLGCEQICINTIGSYYCTCRLGFILAEDKRSCKDIDECKLGVGHHGCSHRCNNFKGTYHCSCPYGMLLDSTRKRCYGGENYVVRFSKSEYRGYVSMDSRIATPVLRIGAIAVSQNNASARKPLKFTITGENNGTVKRNFHFSINPATGEIHSRKILYRQGSTEFVLIVKAALDEWIFSTATVFIRVNGSRNANNVTDFHRSFTVLVHQGLSKGYVIFDLSQHYRSKYFTFIYRLAKPNKYFQIDQRNGQLYATGQIDNVTLSKTNWRSDIDVIIYRNKGSFRVFRCKIIIIFLPTYPGENYLTRDILNSVAEDLSKDRSYLDGRVRFFSSNGKKKASMRAIGLHRLFRRPSSQSREVSKAKLYFDKVIEKIEQKLKDSYSDRERSGPIFFNLGTGQIVSPGKLSGIVEASRCKEASPTPNCIEHFHSRYRTFDGTCNNIGHPRWGAATTTFKRLVPAKYYDVDGLSDPIGFPNLPEAPDLPSPHEVSQLFVISSPISEGNSEDFSLMLMQWGQFVDHDITFTAESEGGHHCILPRCDNTAADFSSPCFPIMYPGNIGDCTMFIRSAAVCQTSQNQIESRQQMNTITSFLDGSVVYGSSLEDSTRLRKVDGSGELKLQSNFLLPFIEAPQHPPLSFCRDFGGCFDAGDVRVNEHVALASMHTLFAREHNRIAKILRNHNRNWEEIRIYQEARKIVGALIQHITYVEFLPKILGKSGLHIYNKCNENVDPSVTNVFATAAFRFGHSLVRPSFPQLNENFDRLNEDLPLVHAFFNNTLLLQTGIERFLFGLIGNKSEAVDRKIASGLVNQLFQRPGASHGFNLIALNIQRGRDHGLPGYGAWRRYCGLKNAYSFEGTANEIKDPNTRAILRILYNDRVTYADVLVAGLAEDPLPGSLVGPTFHCLIKEQFEHLRNGDRYFYENEDVFTASQLREIKKGSLARVMCDNLKGIVSVQPDVFLAVNKNSRRQSCDNIPGINLEFWRENTPVSDVGGVGEWSKWVTSTRLPSGSWATVLQEPVCENKTVTDIECQTADGMPYSNAGENVVCDKGLGVYCRDGEQRKKGTKCSDYRFRLRCLGSVDKGRTEEQKVTGYPQTKTPPSMNCTKSTRYVKEGGLGVLVYTPRDYAAIFPPAEETVLDKPYSIPPANEYLLLGKGEQDTRKRLLFKFDLRRVKRYDVVHSATLQLYFIGLDDSYTGNSLQGYFPRALSIEVFLVTSVNWSRKNVTSRFPWHRDHLEIGKDTEVKRLSKTVVATEQSSWVELDIYRAVYRWRISTMLRAQNFGVMVKVEDDDYPEGVYRFASSWHPNESIRPRLRVCMTATAW